MSKFKREGLLSWTDEPWNSYLYWQTQDSNSQQEKTFKLINKLIADVLRSPFDDMGKSEALK